MNGEVAKKHVRGMRNTGGTLMTISSVYVTCSKRTSSTTTLATGPITRAGTIITTRITTIEGGTERGRLGMEYGGMEIENAKLLAS